MEICHTSQLYAILKIVNIDKLLEKIGQNSNQCYVFITKNIKLWKLTCLY